MKKIAPVTSALLQDLWTRVVEGKTGAGDAQVLRIVEEEVRAMRIVVTEARALLGSGIPHSPQWGCCPYCRLHFKLARLAKVSK
jgi:hypothetical protein